MAPGALQTSPPEEPPPPLLAGVGAMVSADSLRAMRVTIEIADALWERLLELAEERGVEPAQLIDEAIEQYLRQEERASSFP